MKTDFESRIFTGSQLRAAESKGNEMALAGYAAVFNTLSHDLGGFREQIHPRAFTRALSEKQDVRFLMNHDPNKILGRVSSGTLQLSADARGLSFRCQLDRNQSCHRDLWQSVKRGDCTDCSFAFSVNGPDGEQWDDGTDERGQRFARRTLTDVNLLDASVVTYPAYPGTSVAARDASGVVASALQMDHEAWRRAMLSRAALIGRRIAADQLAAVKIERVRMSPEEFDAYARERADALAEEIRQEN